MLSAESREIVVDNLEEGRQVMVGFSRVVDHLIQKIQAGDIDDRTFQLCDHIRANWNRNCGVISTLETEAARVRNAATNELLNSLRDISRQSESLGQS